MHTDTLSYHTCHFAYYYHYDVCFVFSMPHAICSETGQGACSVIAPVLPPVGHGPNTGVFTQSARIHRPQGWRPDMFCIVGLHKPYISVFFLHFCTFVSFLCLSILDFFTYLLRFFLLQWVSTINEGREPLHNTNKRGDNGGLGLYWVHGPT